MKQLLVVFVIVSCLMLSNLNCKNNSDSPTSPPIIPPTTPKIARAELYVPEDTTGFGATYSYHDSTYFFAADLNPHPVGLPLGVKLYDSTRHDITSKVTIDFRAVLDDTTVATISMYSRVGLVSIAIKQPPFGDWWTKHLSVYAFIYANGDTIKTQTISNIVAKPLLYAYQYPGLPDVLMTSNAPWFDPGGHGVGMQQVGDSITYFEVYRLATFRPIAVGDGPNFHFVQEGGDSLHGYSLDGSWSSYTQASGVFDPHWAPLGGPYSFTLLRFNPTK